MPCRPTRDEVRALQDQIKTVQQDSERITSGITVGEQNLALLAKLENFTASTLASMTDKGLLNGDATIALTKFIMTTSRAGQHPSGAGATKARGQFRRRSISSRKDSRN